MQSLRQFHLELATIKENERESGSDVETEDEDFYLVEETDIHAEDINYDLYPWLNPEHPLFFPTHQSQTKTTRWQAVNQFSIENWYTHLQKHTFLSQFLTLEYEDILFLMDKAPPEYNSLKLEESLNTLLSSFKNKEAFMRLSTRSPKDSPALFEESTLTMSKDLYNWDDLDNKNQQLVSFVSSMLKSMKMRDGKKIINTIKQSSRVLNDLMALTFTNEPEKCKTNIILREWHNIHPQHEFRIFVSRRNRKESIVTAIEPYFHFLYYDPRSSYYLDFSDAKSKNTISSRLENYVLKSVDPDVANFLNFSSEQDKDETSSYIREYIIDVALIPEEQYSGKLCENNTLIINEMTYAMVVIELNPFAPAATGSGLFSWRDDLMKLWGKEACDYPLFRHRESPRKNMAGVTLLPTDYELVISNAIFKRQADSKQLLRHGLFSNTTEAEVEKKPLSPSITNS